MSFTWGRRDGARLSRMEGAHALLMMKGRQTSRWVEVQWWGRAGVKGGEVKRVKVEEAEVKWAKAEGPGPR